MNKLRSVLPGILLFAVFTVFTALMCYVDVQPVGMASTGLGFATLNTDVNRALGSNETIYKITEILGYLTWGVVALFGLLGLYQLIRRKSLLKVDRDIIVLGIGYAVMLAFYVLFDKFPLNYRPPYPWNEGELEASYPSSHTLMLVFVMATAVMQISHRITKKTLRLLLNIACIAIAVVVTAGRLLAGVHWFTDIIGGILLAAALAALYYGIAWGKKDRTDNTAAE